MDAELMSSDARIDEDGDLVAAARRGSRSAFDRLVERHQQRIFNLALSSTANAADAQDLTQEAFVRAYRSIRAFRGESSFKTWLYSVATNVIRTHLTSRGRRRWVWSQPHADDGGAGAPEAVADRVDLESDVIRRDAIDRALASLPVEQRLAVTLRDIHGFDYREIAAMLKVPIGTVESRIFRGRERLRHALAPLLHRRARPAQPQGAVTSER